MPAVKRQAVEILVQEHGLSIVRACGAVRLSRRYRAPGSSMERDRGVIDVLNEIVARKPRWGFWTLPDRVRIDKPRALRLDNGSDLTSIAFTEWCQHQKD